MDRSLVVLVAFAAAALLSFSGDRALATDEPDELMPGKLGIARPLGRTVFVSRGPLDFALPSPANDPTVEGATLRVFDTGGAAGDHTYVLPAANWRAVGPAGSKGFRYKRAVFNEPCGFVKVSPTVVLGRCRHPIGPDWAPPFSGDMGVVLTIGTGSKRYCATFGGTTIINSPRGLRRVGAPAPSACASPSGAFLDETPGGVVD